MLVPFGNNWIQKLLSPYGLVQTFGSPQNFFKSIFFPNWSASSPIT